MLNLIDLDLENAIHPLWRQAFRPFFLAGALFSIAALASWGLFLSGLLSFTPYGGATFWHGHEMLFGFAGAIIVGFLLTAVQNWTGLRATHGRSLLLLWGLWLLARLLLLFDWAGLAWVVVLLDLSFFPLTAFMMSALVIKAGNKRNLFFVPLLLLLCGANALTHLSVLTGDSSYYRWGFYAGVMLVSALMAVMGGRVIPMFTANGTGTPRVPPKPWLDRSVLISTWLLVLLYVTQAITLLPAWVNGSLFALAALGNAYRAFYWRPWVTVKVPLVWSLHLAYWFIPLGFALFALHFWGLNVTASTALHSLTAGAMGSLILAMIARVSLGHTGRPLAIGKAVAIAFALIVLAGMVRLVTGLQPALLPINGYLLSAGLWVLAYSIYVSQYFTILTSPRADGRPG